MSVALNLSVIQNYVTQLFTDNRKDYLVFHNFQHTANVVLHCDEMTEWHSLNEHDSNIVIAAAWFHDTGHLFTDMAGHEAKSIAIMKDFLTAENVAGEDIQKIEQCILNAGAAQQPKTFLEEILCDADLYHLGTDYFKTTNFLVKREMELRNNIEIKNWEEKSLEFLLKHKYFTDYCRQRLEKGKEKNIDFLKKLIKMYGENEN